MKQLEKPKFFNTSSFINIIGVVGFVVGIIQFLIPENALSFNYKIYIFIAILFFCFTMYLFQYIYNWHKFYKGYKEFENKFNELENRYNQRIKELKDKDITLEEYAFLISSIQEFIRISLTRNSAKETQQILNLQNLINKDIEHLMRMKGE